MIPLFRSLFAPPRHLIPILAALWIGLALAEKRAERHGISSDALSRVMHYSLLGYILSGRLTFALSKLPAFVESPLSLFSLNHDLFDPWAALVMAVLIGIIYGSKQKLPFWSTLDALTPLFAVLAIGLSLSHLAAGTAFGSPTNVPWGIELWNAMRHPTQMYDLIAATVILGFVWFRKDAPPAGSSFLLFAALTAGVRLFVEAFRGDSILILGGLRLAQLVAWVVLAAALCVTEALRKSRPAN